ncbi:MAG TPA: sigma 54-interacting transcriptional regulator [Pyrinomonadaceae bacterium]|jgi:DNA-binding NtrC family response regulator
MSIALLGTEIIFLPEVARLLKSEEVKVYHSVLEDLLKNKIADDVESVFLIVPKHGTGELISFARKWIGKERKLILCAPQSYMNSSWLLKEMGANEIITPRSWKKAEDIAERILAQLILDGNITPTASGCLKGGTKQMRDLYKEIDITAKVSDPALILGETGTGKELVAREIHLQSQRRGKFVTINCGELGREMINSELFGHKKGAFTGAIDTRQGLFALAGGGSIFLDEIGELDSAAQAVLLRVLENAEMRQVGSNEPTKILARFILATNRNLEEECSAHRFRQDLLERIRGFAISLCPLRERRADIPLLVNHFIAEFCQEYDKKLYLPEGIYECLFNYDWIGNVRELRAAVRRAAANADSEGKVDFYQLLQATLRKGHQEMPASEGASEKNIISFNPKCDSWKDIMKHAQDIYFPAIIESAGGNKEEARRVSGLGKSQFYEKLREINKESESV